MRLSLPVALFADAGLPMISFTLPVMLVLLIPVVIIEGLLVENG